MRSPLPRRLPDRFHRIELGRVGRQPIQLYPVRVIREPSLPSRWETMAGGVVDDHEYLAIPILSHEILQKRPEGHAIEYFGEVISELCVRKTHRTKQMGCFPLSVSINPRLAAHR